MSSQKVEINAPSHVATCLCASSHLLDGDSDGCGFYSCSWSDDLESKSANFDVAYGLLDVLADFPDVTQVEDILEVVGWRDWVVVVVVGVVVVVEFLAAPSRMIAWR